MSEYDRDIVLSHANHVNEFPASQVQVSRVPMLSLTSKPLESAPRLDGGPPVAPGG